MTYMGNFGAQEIAMFQRGLKNILRAESPKDKGLAMREVMSIGTSGIMYGTLSAASYGYMNYLYQRQALENQLEDPKFADQTDYIKSQISQLDVDWGKQYKDLTSPDHIYQQTITNAMFLMNSKYSSTVKMTMAGSVGLIDAWIGDDNKNFVDAGGQPSVYQEYSEMAKEWMQTVTYARTPDDVGGIAELMLPQLDAFFDVFYDQAPREFWDYMDSGIYRPDKHEEFKEEINALTWSTNILKMLQFTGGGRPIPLIKDLDMALRNWDKIYGVDVKEYQEFLDKAQDDKLITSSTVGEPEGVSKVGEPEGVSKVGETESITLKTLPKDGEFDADYSKAVQDFQYWMYSEKELKAMFPKEDLIVMLPREMWVQFLANKDSLPFTWTPEN